MGYVTFMEDSMRHRLFLFMLLLTLGSALPCAAAPKGGAGYDLDALREEARQAPADLNTAFFLARALDRMAMREEDPSGSIALYEEECAALMTGLRTLDWREASLLERSMGYKMLDQLASAVVQLLECDRTRPESRALGLELLEFARTVSMDEAPGYAPAAARTADVLAVAMTDATPGAEIAARNALFDEAHALLRTHLENHPGSDSTRYVLVYSLMAAASMKETGADRDKDFEEARTLAENASIMNMEESNRMLMYHDLYQAALAEESYLREFWLARAEILWCRVYDAWNPSREGAVIRANFAAVRGDAEGALRELEAVIERYPGYASRLRRRIAQTPVFKSIADDPAFSAWLDALSREN